MRYFAKPTAFSFVLHAGVLLALAVVPLNQLRRFSAAGKRSAVTIEMTLSPSNSVSRPPDLAASVSMERVERSDQRFVEPSARTETILRADAQSSQISPSIDLDFLGDRNLGVNVDRMRRKRLANNELASLPKNLLQKTEVLRPKRSKVVTAVLSQPPAISSPKMPENLGLEEQESADFSNNPAPSYPVDAIRSGLEGVVRLELEVSQLGEVISVRVIQSSGHDILDRAASLAVSAWKGKPALRWGRPIASKEVLPIRFRL